MAIFGDTSSFGRTRARGMSFGGGMGMRPNVGMRPPMNTYNNEIGGMMAWGDMSPAQRAMENRQYAGYYGNPNAGRQNDGWQEGRVLYKRPQVNYTSRGNARGAIQFGDSFQSGTARGYASPFQRPQSRYRPSQKSPTINWSQFAPNQQEQGSYAKPSAPAFNWHVSQAEYDAIQPRKATVPSLGELWGDNHQYQYNSEAERQRAMDEFSNPNNYRGFGYQNPNAQEQMWRQQYGAMPQMYEGKVYPTPNNIFTIGRTPPMMRPTPEKRQAHNIFTWGWR